MSCEDSHSFRAIEGHGTYEIARLYQRIIFDPIPRVDGIEPSADPLLEFRAAIYLLSGRERRVATPQRTG
jgi:hypothetical protein